MIRRLTLILFLTSLAVACRRQSGPAPSPTAPTGSPTAQAQEQEPASEPAGEDQSTNGDESSASVDAAFADNADLRAARFAVVFHMTQIEGMSFPLVDEWTPESVSEEGDFRTYTFRSGEWTLSLASPLEEMPDLLYHVTITGPDDFVYRAQMDEDGNLAPAQ